MNTLSGIVFSVAVFLILTELLAGICPKNQILFFLRGLIVTAILVSGIASLMKMDVDFSQFDYNAQAQDGRLNIYIEEEMTNSIERDIAGYIDELLKTISVETKEIRIFTDKNENDSIRIEKIAIMLVYETDRERAEAVVRNVIGADVEIEMR